MKTGTADYFVKGAVTQLSTTSGTASHRSGLRSIERGIVINWDTKITLVTGAANS